MERIARDEADRGRIVATRPSAPFPAGSRLVCRDEVAIFSRWGSACGMLGPGEHALDPAAVPFLANVTDAGRIECDVHFVTTVEVGVGLRKKKPIVDPLSSEMVDVELTAEARVRASDPMRLHAAMTGMGGGEEGLRTWIERVVGGAVFTALGRVLDERQCSVLELVAPDGAAAVRDRALAAPPGDLQEQGLELAGFGAFVLSVGDQDAARVREALAQVQTMQGALAATQTDGSLLESPFTATHAEASGPTAPLASTPESLGVGATVQALYSDGRYYPARVVQMSRGHYEVAWEGGSGTTWVGPHQLLPAAPSGPAGLAVGAHVLARWTDGNVYGATIRQRRGRQYEVAWDAGGTAWIPEQHLKPG